jgi:hypothetical protein
LSHPFRAAAAILAAPGVLVACGSPDRATLPTTEFNVAMRRVFWGPLDDLVAEVR